MGWPLSPPRARGWQPSRSSRKSPCVADGEQPLAHAPAGGEGEGSGLQGDGDRDGDRGWTCPAQGSATEAGPLGWVLSENPPKRPV